MNSRKFWIDRFSGWMKEFQRYSRYIFTDHFAIVLLLVIGGGAYYYQDWVEGLGPNFPTAYLFALLFAFLLVKGYVSTFLQDPDKVFLLPLEMQLKPYMVNSFIFSYVWQSFGTILILLVVAPIYTKTVSEPGLTLFILFLLLLKGINLWIRWNIDYEADQTFLLWDAVLRFLLNAGIVFLFLENQLILSIIVAVILCFYGLYFRWRIREKGLPWERLIENEEKRLGRFYRIANIFTDVPHLRNQIRRRKWLDLFLYAIPFQQEKSYTYLFWRTFSRSGEYFGLFLRLTIIGGFFIWAFRGTYTAYFLALFFIYITGIQLFGIWKHHDGIIWTSLYPIEDAIKKKAYLKLLLNLLWTQNLLFVLLYITSGEWLQGLGLFVLVSLFTYLFVYFYIQARIKKGKNSI